MPEMVSEPITGIVVNGCFAASAMAWGQSCSTLSRPGKASSGRQSSFNDVSNELVFSRTARRRDPR
jgi:hypothetical protein